MAARPKSGSTAPENQEQKPVSAVRLWIGDHVTAIVICSAIVVIAGIFFGIRIYHNANHPVTRLMRAASKDFNSSFTFELKANKNGETVMEYSGSYEADPAKGKLKALYDADYGRYAYQGAVYVDGDTAVSGSLYNGKWRARDASEKAMNFFDFNTDFKKGEFDGSSFLRFTDLTSRYSAPDLNKFMKLFKDRMSGKSSLAKLTTSSSSGNKSYSYEIDVSEFFDMVRDDGASIFYSAIDYESFCELYELNRDNIENANCTFNFTINRSGWLADFDFRLFTGKDEFELICSMDDFGTTGVDLPQEFLDAEIPEE